MTIQMYNPIFLDTETAGLTGPIITIQTLSREEYVYWEVWYEPVYKTLEVIEWLTENMPVCWNLTFDWFQINKLYNLFMCVADKQSLPNIAEVYDIEQKLPNKWCVKPRDALDLLSYARSGPLQFLMRNEKGNVFRIKSVHKSVALDLCYHLNSYTNLPDIMFHKGHKWQVAETKRSEFKDLVLKLGPTLALKPVIKHLFPGEKTDTHGCPFLIEDKDQLWKPYGTLWKFMLPKIAEFWHTNERAQIYARNDVYYLKRLYDLWDHPDPSDSDILAAAISACRWHGFEIDLPRVKHNMQNQRLVSQLPACNVNSPKEVIGYITEKNALKRVELLDTSKETMKRFISKNNNEYGTRALQVVNARKALKRMDTLEKLLKAKRFFPDFVIVGTKSNRMAGTGGFNATGIPRDKSIRECFTFASPNYTLSGGDFNAFEVSIAEAVFQDNNLSYDLRSGKSVHGLFGAEMLGRPYEEVVDKTNGVYNPCKNGFFAFLYGADVPKIAETIGIPIKEAQRGFIKFNKRYPTACEIRQKVMDQFCTMHQPLGIGSKVYYKEPSNEIKSLYDFARRYDTQNHIIKVLFETAEHIETVVQSDGTCTRMEREQKITSSVRSALYATCFKIQQHNMRSAFNHIIQSTGATICKRLQVDLWDEQPYGCSEWNVLVFQVHDEVLCVHRKEIDTNEIVNDSLERFSRVVPLVCMEWKTNLKNWSEK